jgi:hypothetical protein
VTRGCWFVFVVVVVVVVVVVKRADVNKEKKHKRNEWSELWRKVFTFFKSSKKVKADRHRDIGLTFSR